MITMKFKKTLWLSSAIGLFFSLIPCLHAGAVKNSLSALSGPVSQCETNHVQSSIGQSTKRERQVSFSELVAVRPIENLTDTKVVSRGKKRKREEEKEEKKEATF